MKLTFLGAAHEVTGSCSLLEACGKRILIDCGMEQGADTFVNCELPVLPGQIDAVLLTHAHIDHSGKVPALTAQGFTGPIYATQATHRLCGIMLRDSAHIQESEAEWKNRKARRAGRPEVLPLYDTNDANGVLEHFIPCEYQRKIEVCEGLEVRFVDAGHLLGSASIEVWLEENGISKKIVFSGDTLFAESIGRTDFPGGSMAEIVRSIEEKLLVLPEETIVYPGHEESTSVGYEKKFNPYVKRRF